LLTPRIRPYYVKSGMGQYFNGLAAPELSGEQMIADLDRARMPRKLHLLVLTWRATPCQSATALHKQK
jgi:hypothetical protein